MEIMLYDKDNIEDLKFPNDYNSSYAKRYILPFIVEGTEKFINNVDAEVKILKINNILLPITITETSYNDSYVVSTYSHYVNYAKDEIKLLFRGLKSKLAILFLDLLGCVLKFSKINKTVMVNNWLLSTNLYVDISQNEIEAITKFLTDRFKDYSIVFRSIHTYTESNRIIYDSLGHSGYTMIPSRQVYFAQKMDEIRSICRNCLKRDMGAIKKNNLIIEDVCSDSNLAPRIVELYNALYLDKYSKYNPQFNEAFIEKAIDEELFHFKLIYCNNVIVGCLGYFIRNGIMTTPIFGYDTNLPSEIGIYRALSLKLQIESEEKALVLHSSSGAGRFKASRGAIKAIEYSGVYLKHLSFRRKIGWLSIEFITKNFMLDKVINHNF